MTSKEKSKNIKSKNFYLWGEELSLDEAFLRLKDNEAQNSIIKDLTKRLILQKGFLDYNIEIDLNDPNIQENLLLTFCKTYKINNLQELETTLDKQKESKTELLNKLSYQEKIHRLKHITVTQQAISDLFIQQKANLDLITFAIIRFDSNNKAKEIYHRLNDDNEDFTELAKQHSIGDESHNGGLIGPTQLSNLNPQLRSQLSKLKPGEITEPFTLENQNIFIVKLIKLEAAQMTPQLENTFRDKLFEQWIHKQIQLSSVKLIQEQTDKVFV
jgi:parvulin-like peptidyl-prolyl isomerase